MSALGVRQVEGRGAGPAAQIRDLTIDEVNEVAGGVLPIVGIVAVVLIAAAIEECSEDSSSDSEDDGGDGDD